MICKSRIGVEFIYIASHFFLYASCVIVISCSDYHSWLLSDEVDLLPTLLLPLAGPEEVGDDEVMEKLPEDLQYLPEDKQREAEPDIRKMLLETLMQVHT